jgi:Family of unknown function (DUF5681)
MSDDDANAAPPAKSRTNSGKFVPGQSANPAGKRPGTRNRRTILAAKLMANIDVPGILARMEKDALKGDKAAARLLLERTIPPRRGFPIAIKLPAISTAADIVAAMSVVMAELASGTLSTIEASELSAVIDAARKAIELNDVEKRLHALEERFK